MKSLKRMHVRVATFLASLMVAALPTACLAAGVFLHWDPSTDPEIVGYKVYYQADSLAVPFAGTGAAEGSAPIDVLNTTSTTLTNLDPGSSYNFAVTAYTSAGEESLYSNILTVPESVPPVVTISSPIEASVSGMVSIAATANDNVGVAKVEMYINDHLYATPTAPYNCNWDTTSLPSGTYTIMVKAYDAAGNVGEAKKLVAINNGDLISPVVSITSPTANASLSGTVTVTADATDNVGVTKIEIYDNGNLAYATNQSPASYLWNSAMSANGTHTIVAKAYDSAGNIAQSGDVTVTVVNDTTAPSVSITSPVDNAIVGGTVVVSTNASDNVAVSKVEFYVNGSLQSASSSAPYNYNWDTTALANGSYTLTALAYDAAGNVGRSNSVAVNILRDSTAPTITFLAPTQSFVYGNNVKISATATDNVAVTRMEMYINGSLQYSTTKSSFTTSWNFPVGVSYITVKAYDAANNIQTVTKNVNRFK